MATVDADGVPGELLAAEAARGAVLFAHGTGSDRHSARNRVVAERLRDAGLTSLLIDLPRDMMESVRRLETALGWLRVDQGLQVGLFGASTGAASALGVAGQRPDDVAAVVSRGGRPDLTPADVLAAVRAPTLFVVGERDERVRAVNDQARAAMTATTAVAIVPGASHLFEEPGTLAQVAELSAGWFTSRGVW
jgi:putative phosphoribosyl transferase